MRRVVAFLAAIVLAGVVLLPSAEVSAHAALAASEPANNALLRRAPDRILLTFTEPLETQASGVQLLDATGAEIAVAPPQFGGADGNVMRVQLPVLEPGIYNVVWFNVSSIDGHALRGSYPFTVLNPDGSLPDVVNQVGGICSDPDPAPLTDGVMVRILALLGLLGAAGGALLALLWREAPVRARRTFATLAIVGAAILVVATLLNLQVLRNEYSGQSLADVVLRTRVGGYWLTRLGAAFLIGIIGTMLVDSPRKGGAGVLGGVALAIWSFAATSHGAAGSGSYWGIAFDLIHGLTALLWIGAVIGFVFAARSTGGEGRFGQLLPRFSTAASVLVFVLITTGIVNAFVEIDKVERLVDTRYGVTLVVKLVLMAPLLAVAYYNARRGKRALEQDGGRRRFILTGGAEALLGLAVFVPAAMLTQTGVAKSVPEDQEARPYNEEMTLDDLTVALAIDPNRVGINTYFVRLSSGGQPVEADRVQLTFRHQDDVTLGPSSTVLEPGEGGTYSAQAAFLAQEGPWRIEVEVRRPDVDDLRVNFDVRPAGPPVVTVQRGGPWDNPAPGLSWNEFGGIVVLFIALGFALWRRPLGALNQQVGWAANAVVVLGFATGTLLLFGVHEDPAPEGIGPNPIAADRDSVDRGREIYLANCATCHGRNGVPPEGLDLNPYPLDLTVHAPLHPDAQLFDFIANGVPGTAMPAWSEGENALSDEEIWHVVNFLRTLGAADR